MSILSPVLKIGEAVAVWLNPERRERATLMGAIESAEELIRIKDAMILRGVNPFKDTRPEVGRYSSFTDKQLIEYELHFKKRFISWKDGKG